jgi:hypothetical protein
MTIQLTITETPTLAAEDLSRFCEIASKEGISPEEKLAKIIKEVIPAKPAKKEASK